MKNASTNFGEPLSIESRKLVNELRLKINQPIHPNFDTDFNLYRFILAAERAHKKEKEIIDVAAKAINSHLRIRKALNLDHQPDVPFEKNELFKNRYLPMGQILSVTDSSNRLLWYVEYATINVEPLAHIFRSSHSIRLQFLQYEHMLRTVNKQEEKTGKLSGLRHIVDLSGYEINPFMMLFVTNGSLTYYSHLFHYENYPELVGPIDMVNIAKWIHVPYKIVRTMMPMGFTERFRLHDDNFLGALKDIKIEDIPTTLGGKNEHIRCTPAIKVTSEMHWKPTNIELLSNLETIHIPPRKTRQIHIDITESHRRMAWYFTTDGEINFGIFYQPFEELPSTGAINHMRTTEKEIDTDQLEMIYPWFKLSAKLVHETDSVECIQPGRYWMIFCNKLSWLHRKTINLSVQIADNNFDNIKRYHTDGTYSNSKLFEFPNIQLYSLI